MQNLKVCKENLITNLTQDHWQQLKEIENMEYIWETKEIRYILLSLLAIVIIMIIILFIIHLKKSKRGEHSKFFWIESNSTPKPEEKSQGTQLIKGKNINTGKNFGKIGDN